MFDKVLWSERCHLVVFNEPNSCTSGFQSTCGIIAHHVINHRQMPVKKEDAILVFYKSLMHILLYTKYTRLIQISPLNYHCNAIEIEQNLNSPPSYTNNRCCPQYYPFNLQHTLLQCRRGTSALPREISKQILDCLIRCCAVC